MEEKKEEPGIFSDAKSFGLFVWDFLKVIIIALVIILPIRYFVFQPFIVSGNSMLPNFEDGQYLVIDEISYRLRQPERGEVVVLRYPDDPKQYFIKRIVGLPGEKVSIDNGRVTIYNTQHPDGMVLDESYLPTQGLTYPLNSDVIGGKKTLTLSSEQYFTLGDNRLQSSDSRYWGPLPKNDLVGRVLIRAFPLNKFHKFSAPSYSYTAVETL
ncbi:MAG: signal peptidase I [Acidobacteriaceae bacterium]